MMAMASGLTWTPLARMAWAATPASPDAVTAGPENAWTVRSQGVPRPNAFSAAARLDGVSRSDTVANAVPQPAAKSEEKVAELDCPGEYVNVCPPTFATPWQGTGELAGRPARSSAAADTIVNAMPGRIRAFSRPPGGSGMSLGAWLARTGTVPRAQPPPHRPPLGSTHAA